MYQPKPVSPKQNKSLLILNALLALISLVSGLMALYYSQWTIVLGMTLVVLSSCINVYTCWKRMKTKRMKTGIFSGSFNPVHIGHLALANYLCEYEGLDEVWFLVTPHNPLKEEDELMDDAFRLKLVQLAIEGYPKFKASDIEFNLPRPSYTIHTLDKLKETYPDREFHLIIGSDNWALFPRWYQSERILAENHILVYPRPGYPVSSDSLSENVKVASSPTFEISSTFIRRAMEEGKDVRYFLHPAVYEALSSEFPR